MMDIKRIAIVGTGLLGGSIGLAMRRGGFKGEIVGVGRREETLACAKERGCIDVGMRDLAEAGRVSELVILATPLSAFGQAFEQLAGCGNRQLVVTDVGSTKEKVLEEGRRILGLGLGRRLVGSHPMAGAEVHGPQAARADLFAGKPCVVCASGQEEAGVVELVEGLWTGLGMKVIRMSEKEHDEKVARVSHLPHALAVLLVGMAEKEGGLEVASTGFRDTTRIAGGDEQVWADVFMSNQDAVVGAMGTLAKEMQHFARLVQTGDRAGLVELLKQSKQTRAKWMNQRWGTEE